ncbi:MAG: hypothetical protein L3J98_10740 [Gammaproteobacteria bacterium]|nr:hypothetical protein [Gammaproteobacteria bacterium]MCF6260615.1 hypothetical protein [Gammaproteobacteria bacterium]
MKIQYKGVEDEKGERVRRERYKKSSNVVDFCAFALKTYLITHEAQP